MDRSFSNLKDLLPSLLRALGGHFRTLYLDLDPVKDAHIYQISRYYLFQQQQPKTPSFSNRAALTSFHIPYLFPTLTMLYLAVDSALILRQIGFQLGNTSTTAAFLFSHRIFPKELWPQSDTMALLGVALAGFIYVCLLVTPKLEEKYIMYLFDNGNKNQRNSNGVVELIQNGRGKVFNF